MGTSRRVFLDLPFRESLQTQNETRKPSYQQVNQKPDSKKTKLPERKLENRQLEKQENMEPAGVDRVDAVVNGRTADTHSSSIVLNMMMTL